MLEFAAKSGDAGCVFREGLAGEVRGFAEPDDAGNIFGARAESPLMVAAVEKLTEARTASDVECPDALRRIKLVARDSEKIDTESVDVEGNFSCGLHGVGVEIDVVLRGDAPDLLEWLDGAEFVVGVHHGD
jgi:hypothetical protein